MVKTLLRFTNIILAALLAGTSFGIWMGLDPSRYAPSTYLEQQNHLVASLNTLMVSLVVAATIVSAVTAYLHRQDKMVFASYVVAAASFGLCLLISRFGNLPIQEEMLQWTVETMTSNWTVMRDQWWSYHIARTVAELVGLVMVTWAGLQSRTS